MKDEVRLSNVMERVAPLPLEFLLFLLCLLAHHCLDLRTHNVLWGDVHARIILQPRASIPTALYDLRPKVEYVVRVRLCAHEFALETHIPDEEQLGEGVAAEEGLDLG